MRIIGCRIENFGKLHRASYDFTDGLNVISAENGAGKSTLAAFIRVMLYGFENEKKRNAYENERRRYAPWQGGAYGGTLTFEAEGVSYVVSRSFGKKEKEDTFELREAATNLISTRYSEKLGEELFQIDSNSFVRTVFISQNDCATKATDAVNAKIGNLSETTDDLSRFDEADGRLHDLVNAMSPYRKTGALAKKKEEISLLAEAVGQLDTVEAAQEEIAQKREEKRKELALLQEKRETCEKQQKALGRYQDAKAKTESLKVLKARAAECKQRRDAERAGFRGTVPTEEQLEDCMQSCIRFSGERKLAAANALSAEEEVKLQELKAQFANIAQPEEVLQECARLIGERDALEREISEAERTLLGTRERLAAQSASRERLQMQRQMEDLQREADRRKDKRIKGVLIVLLIAAVTGCIVFGITDTGVIGNALLAVCVVCGCAFGALLAAAFAKSKRLAAQERVQTESIAETETEELEQQIEKQSAGIAVKNEKAGALAQTLREHFAALHETYREETALKTLHALQLRYADLRALDAKRERALAQEEICRNLQARLQEEAAPLLTDDRTQCREASDPEALLTKIRCLQQALQQYKRTCMELKKAEEALAQFAGSEDTERLQRIVAEYENTSDAGLSMEDVGSMLAQISEQTDAARKSLAGYERQQEQLIQRGDELLEQKERLDALRAEYVRDTEKYRLLVKTQEYLAQAKTGLTAKYMEPLRSGFAKYYRLLTGCEADAFWLDADANLTVEEYGAQHEARCLSAGYRDLTGLCLRMALIDAMYGGEKPFIVFDDPFVNLDSEKQKRGQAFLKEIAREYQALYFTCS